jgi:hypothetical protein
METKRAAGKRSTSNVEWEMHPEVHEQVKALRETVQRITGKLVNQHTFSARVFDAIDDHL